MLKITFLISTFVISLTTASAGNICDIAPPQSKVQKLPIHKYPNYFFKTSPDGRYFYYISEGSNWVLDSETGMVEQIPGHMDPVPSGDGEVLTYIEQGKNEFSLRATPMAFLWEPPSSKTIKSFSELGKSKGSYQSVGSKRADGTRVFLYQDDETGHILIHDLVQNRNSYELKNRSILIDGADDLHTYRLPMLSPDGRFLSALNTATNKTQIFEIIGTPPKAVLKDTLPVSAGKANFSYDNKKLTFHLAMKTGNSREENYATWIVTTGSLRNIYTYDLKTKKINAITNHENVQHTDKKRLDIDSYFPIFLQDGRIAYITITTDLSQNIHRDLPEFNVLTLASEDAGRNFNDIVSCYGTDAPNQMLRLADLWAKQCNKWNADTDDTVDGGIALATALNLSNEACVEVAKEDVKLLKLCKAMNGQSVEKENGNGVVKISAPTKESKVFQNKCAICHQHNMDQIAKSPTLEQRLNGTFKPSMPPNGSKLKPTEIKEILEYLK